MKLIFLDIDGVMCTTSCYGRGTHNKWDAYMFDPKAVAVLNFILQETNAEIIISSDWRNNYTLQELREIFAHNFVFKGPIGFTPSSPLYKGNSLEEGRADEIKTWLTIHAWKNDIKWVAIDDIDMSNFLGYNFVRCPNEQEGIKKTGIKEKILSILNEQNS